MKEILVEQKNLKAINGNFLSNFIEAQNEEYNEHPCTSNILHISFTVLRNIENFVSIKEL